MELNYHKVLSQTASGASKHDSLMILGFWILVGLVSFVICGKLISNEEDEESEGSEATSQTDSKATDSSNNNIEKISKKGSSEHTQSNNIQVSSRSRVMIFFAYMQCTLLNLSNFPHNFFSLPVTLISLQMPLTISLTVWLLLVAS